jgi:plastocyanin
MKTSRPLAAVAGGLLALVTAGCGGGSSGPPTTLGPNSIVMKNIAYSPTTLTLKVGDTVNFVWKDGSIPHNVDGASDLSDFSSGNAKTSGSYNYTFKKAGTYAYHCDVHPQMTGTITVTS